ncbi:4819_t:CDS:2, partial [Racocetra persica]
IQEHQLDQQRLSEIEDVLQQSTLSAYQRSAIISKMPDLFQELTIVIQNPQVRQTRRRPVGARNHAQSSTERDSSAFELVESERKCGIYHESGHNSRTCPNAESTSEDIESDVDVAEDDVDVVEADIEMVDADIVEKDLVEKDDDIIEID